MNPSREEALFTLALEKPADKRPAFLDAVCEGDAALRQRLEALLAAHDQPDELLATKAEAKDPTLKIEMADEPADEAVGQTLGRYKLLEQVGEGGCGVVYVAEQTEPVRRRVALKVIKLGMDTKQVVARFEAERQALAMMDHPNIAKVLDAGTTDTGRPYFVMELVRGIRITDYCDQNNLSTQERLDLFIKVCQAIQHAHQKGIIHRDIKPSNILVTLHDGVPVPKVIDFGIAKATEGRLTDATVYTQLHQFIGTPAYMSPEQAEMSGLDIDTRSDIYGLGVLLYELLTGRTPFDPKELMASGIDGMRRTIREKEPVRPSTRLATLKRDELTPTAKRRSAEAPKLIHLLKGDLDWIVMKCLEKDRQRRYETANGLAADLKRHLSNETVLARPPSAAYRFQKAFRRNKLVFAAATSIAAALILGVIGTTIGLLRANRAGTLALQSRHEAEKLAMFMLDDLYAELEPSGQFESVTRLARQTVAYYDQLPPSLRTAETDRNRVMARARLALILSRQADIKSAQPLADETVSRIRQMPEKDRSEGMVFALGLALEAQYFCYFAQFSSRLQLAEFEQLIAILRPLAIAADGSRRVKLQYANLLNYLSHLQQPERGVITCGEARSILAGIGALDLSDLNAATAWADIADSEARLSMGIGRLDEAERLEKQVQSLMERVLKIRAGDLRARRNLFFAADMLTLIATRRFQDGEALRWATLARQAAEESHRFNPSDAMAIDSLFYSHYALASLSFRSGRIAEALEKAMETVRTLEELGKTGSYMSRLDGVWAAMAGWEAQRGNREAADQAIQQARRSLDSFASKVQMEEQTKAGQRELIDAAERQVQLAFGDDATVLATATAALPRLEKAKQRATSAYAAAVEQFYQRGAIRQATLAALRLGRLADAERTARVLISLPLPTTEMPTRMAVDQPDDLAWGQVLLAQALVGQGRQAEGLVALQPALVLYREMKGQGAAYLTFHQRFARALYVQALAQSNEAAGAARHRDSLAEAAKVLNELSEEARQLRDTKELLSWIAAAQKRDAQVKQP